MENAIKKAIEGGWKHRLIETFEESLWDKARIKSFVEAFWTEIVCDPEFWKCLGKTEGWHMGIEKAICHKCKFLCTNHKYKFCPEDSTPLEITENIRNSRWLSEWKLFIDHIASGNSVDNFFEELLGNK